SGYRIWQTEFDNWYSGADPSMIHNRLIVTLITTSIIAGVAATSSGTIGKVLLAVSHMVAWPIEALVPMVLASDVGLRPVTVPNMGRRLPFRHDDVIYLTLPGLRELIIELSAVDVAICKTIVAEAGDSVGQSRAAQLALIEIRARNLEQVAHQRSFAAVAN